MTNSQNAMRAALDSHNGRLVDHDPLPAYANKRICSSEVDGHIRGHLASQTREHV